ncbi:MAG: hypothetical protein ACI9CE_003491 [Flavobacterium sp.]|jgi:hypothetical protein
MFKNRTAYNKALCKWESGLAGIGNLSSIFGFKEIRNQRSKSHLRTLRAKQSSSILTTSEFY